MDESRKAFEQSLMDEFGYPKERLEYWRGEGDYSQNQFLSSRWKSWKTAWQASRAAIEIELPDTADYWNGTEGHEVLNHRQLMADSADAIRAAGIKVKE
ncbi:hypothetical protein ACLEVB_17340 [Enterobacter ludwigii]|uniref:hypothetical protein n=1 Tax=Enterobacter ludwigii TaxID=299767 RepID=UPI003976A2D3